MRSVVVVLPASMWAMIPMLRVRSSGYSLIKGAPALPSTALSLGFWRNSGSLAIAFTTNPSNPPTDVAACVVTSSFLPVPIPVTNFLQQNGREAISRPGGFAARKPMSAKPPACFCPKLPPVRVCVRKRTFQLTPPPACRPGASPPVVRERPVRLRHFVQVLPPLHRSTHTVCCIHQLTGQPGLHGALPPCPGEVHDPADRECRRAPGGD